MLKRKFFDFFRLLFKIPPFENLLHYFTKGKDISSLPAKMAPQPYQYHINTYKNCVSNGIHFKVYPREFQNWVVYWEIEEPHDTQLFSMIKPGFIVLDIGANIGYMTLRMAKLVGGHGKIFSFEPDPLNFERLSTNCGLNQYSNIKLFNVGLGRQKSSVLFESGFIDNRGASNVIYEPTPTSTTIPIESLDIIMEANPLPKIDLIKIDVEGYEMEVILGATKTISQFKPIIVIEIIDSVLKLNGSSAEMLLSEIYKLGYHCFEASSNKPVISAKQLGDYNNLYCYHSEKQPK